MAGRARLTLEAVLEELDLEEDDFDYEPMMPGSDDEFSDLEEVCLEDAENDNDDDDNGSVTLCLNPLPLRLRGYTKLAAALLRNRRHIILNSAAVID